MSDETKPLLDHGPGKVKPSAAWPAPQKPSPPPLREVRELGGKSSALLGPKVHVEDVACFVERLGTGDDHRHRWAAEAIREKWGRGSPETKLRRRR